VVRVSPAPRGHAADGHYDHAGGNGAGDPQDRGRDEDPGQVADDRAEVAADRIVSGDAGRRSRDDRVTATGLVGAEPAVVGQAGPEADGVPGRV
jgi:hypothetical protein